MARLTHAFFDHDTLTVAQALLGKYLVRNRNGILLAGRITETEAYIGRCDKACHAYNYRRTPRTETLFLGPGHAYIYFIYGMYHCLNFVTEPEGEPAAVLLRALEPAAGAEIMQQLRFGEEKLSQRPRQGLQGPGPHHGPEQAGPGEQCAVPLRLHGGRRPGKPGHRTGAPLHRPPDRR